MFEKATFTFILDQMIEFNIIGYPVPQGRPRFAVMGGKGGVGMGVRAYDPAKSRDWKGDCKRQLLEKKPTLLEGSLTLVLHFRLPRPKSLPKKIQHHTKKPDVDNLAKAVKDALKGVCYKDDSQVGMLLVTKRYAAEGEHCGVSIGIRQEGTCTTNS